MNQRQHKRRRQLLNFGSKPQPHPPGVQFLPIWRYVRRWHTWVRLSYEIGRIENVRFIESPLLP